ncbi:hypothetical protein JIN85_16995 [Luteolibacter pohnpeiensis]|uniref:Uncharacterized protein n=1 Tax=Luteolibacter pohnpeiensis TaxID=454153 RepID=A0A934VX93_9BACT|nr:hypothetical protein [Luteolibacter pohnpeiensis]MBK1884120.1 hypothetical protein [Luteolibacter pohnpeiensis]
MNALVFHQSLDDRFGFLGFEPENPESSNLELLQGKGYSTRSAAKLLGVDHTHLFRVLTGKRSSHSLLARIDTLPDLSRKP